MIIRAPSRIHMSLIDLNGSYRRVDGGIGLALADPQFVLEIEQIESGIELEFADPVDDVEAIEECREKIEEDHPDQSLSSQSAGIGTGSNGRGFSGQYRLRGHLFCCGCRFFQKRKCDQFTLYDRKPAKRLENL